MRTNEARFQNMSELGMELGPFEPVPLEAEIAPAFAAVTVSTETAGTDPLARRSKARPRWTFSATRLARSQVYRHINTHGTGSVAEILRQCSGRMGDVRPRHSSADRRRNLRAAHSWAQWGTVRCSGSVARPEVLALGEAPLCPIEEKAREDSRAAHRDR